MLPTPSLLWSHDIHFIICSILAAALREIARVCAAKGRIVVVDAYAPEDPDQAAEFNRIERLRDPSHVCSLSLSGRIPVHLDGDNIHVTYRAAILTARRS